MDLEANAPAPSALLQINAKVNAGAHPLRVVRSVASPPHAPPFYVAGIHPTLPRAG